MPPDRRSHDRHRVARPYVANLLLPAGSLVTVAAPIDVSLGGFRTDAARGCLAGERLILEPQRPHRLGGRRFPFVVVRSGGGEIAGAFAREITEADRDALASD
jgi:hypothetical protein